MKMPTKATLSLVSILASLILLPGLVSAQGRVVESDSHRFTEIAEDVWHVVGTGTVFTMSNAMVLVGARDVLVVDSHVTPAAAEALLASLSVITDKPVRYQVNSHYHFDHAHGDQAFPESVEIIGHRFTRAKLAGELGNVLEENTFRSFSEGVPTLVANLERQVAEVVGDERVMGGLCFLCSNKLGPGHVHHLDYGQVEFADYTPNDTPAGITPRMRTISGDFESAGNPIVLSEDLVLARWKKLIWNVPFNGLTVVLDTDTATIMADPAARARAHALMLEVQAAARASVDRQIEDSFIQMMLDWTEKMEPYLPSMKLDHDAGRPLEVEAIFGTPLRAAEAAGCEVPGLREVYTTLRSMEDR